MSDYYVIVEIGGMFWRENGHGYTRDIADAGVFSKDKAERVTSGCKGRGDRMVPLPADDLLTRKTELRRLLDRAQWMHDAAMGIGPNIDEPARQG